MIRVYVAGPYSSDNILDVFENMRRGINLSIKVFQFGMAPFCPWLDYQFSLMNNGMRFTVEDYYKYSMAWLEVSDAILLTDGWRESKGAMAEVDRALELNIPVFNHFMALLSWKENPKGLADGKRPSHK